MAEECGDVTLLMKQRKRKLLADVDTQTHAIQQPSSCNGDVDKETAAVAHTKRRRFEVAPDAQSNRPQSLSSRKRFDPSMTHSDSSMTHSNPPTNHSDSSMTHFDSSMTHSNPAINHSDSSMTHTDSPINHSDSSMTHFDSSMTHSNPAINHSDSSMTHTDSPINRSDSSMIHSNPPVNRSDSSMTHSDSSMAHSDSSQSREDRDEASSVDGDASRNDRDFVVAKRRRRYATNSADQIVTTPLPQQPRRTRSKRKPEVSLGELLRSEAARAPSTSESSSPATGSPPSGSGSPPPTINVSQIETGVLRNAGSGSLSPKALPSSSPPTVDVSQMETTNLENAEVLAFFKKLNFSSLCEQRAVEVVGATNLEELCTLTESDLFKLGEELKLTFVQRRTLIDSVQDLKAAQASPLTNPINADGSNSSDIRSRLSPRSSEVQEKAQSLSGSREVLQKARLVSGSREVQEKARSLSGSREVLEKAQSCSTILDLQERSRSLSGNREVLEKAQLRSTILDLQERSRSRSTNRDVRENAWNVVDSDTSKADGTGEADTRAGEDRRRRRGPRSRRREANGSDSDGSGEEDAELDGDRRRGRSSRSEAAKGKAESERGGEDARSRSLLAGDAEIVCGSTLVRFDGRDVIINDARFCLDFGEDVIKDLLVVDEYLLPTVRLNGKTLRALPNTCEPSDDATSNPGHVVHRVEVTETSVWIDGRELRLEKIRRTTGQQIHNITVRDAHVRVNGKKLSRRHFASSRRNATEEASSRAHARARGRSISPEELCDHFKELGISDRSRSRAPDRSRLRPSDQSQSRYSDRSVSRSRDRSSHSRDRSSRSRGRSSRSRDHDRLSRSRDRPSRSRDRSSRSSDRPMTSIRTVERLTDDVGVEGTSFRESVERSLRRLGRACGVDFGDKTLSDSNPDIAKVYDKLLRQSELFSTETMLTVSEILIPPIGKGEDIGRHQAASAAEEAVSIVDRDADAVHRSVVSDIDQLCDMLRALLHESGGASTGGDKMRAIEKARHDIQRRADKFRARAEGMCIDIIEVMVPEILD